MRTNEEVLVEYKVTTDRGKVRLQFDRGPVQTSMNNTTLPQESDIPLKSPGFRAYSILLTVMTLVAGVVIGLMVIALAMARSIPRPLRLFLINLLLAGLVLAVGMVFLTTTSAVLVVADSAQPRPPLYLCRVYLLMTSVGVVARLWNLAAFSLSVLAIVRFGKKTITLRYAAVIITILWIVPIAICLSILFPYVFEAQFVNGVACFPANISDNIALQYTFFAFWITAGGLIPVTVSTAVPIICLCYIKKNIVTEGIQYHKVMAKFSLFLMLGGAINIAGQLIPGIVSIHSRAPAVYLTYGIAAVSLLPTPVIIIAYLKPAREQVKKMITMVTCGMLTKGAKDSKHSKWATNTPGNNKTEDTV